MGGSRKALIIANDKYDHEEMRHLLAPSADAEALSRVLGDPQIGGFDVQVIRNRSAHVVQQRIEDTFLESRAADVLLLHFSCHGLKSESGELFFAARDTRPNRLGSTAVSADFVQRCMRASRSRSIVVLLDCCYGGAFSQGVTVRAAGDVHVFDSFPSAKAGGARGRAVITASSSMEYAFEGDRLADDQTRRPSVFTAAVVQGLETGEADRDEDGWVSLNELYDYVFDRVREQSPHQTPSRDVEMQGEFYLARSRRHRIHPAAIPPDLEAARTDPNLYTRLGAVSELRSRLAGDNLAAAAGAYDVLADMVRTDSRFVAEEAEAALREAAVRPDVTELHFGRIGQGSTGPHLTVRLLGIPLARACVPRASHPWIRVTEMAEGLAVYVDTSQVGALRGNIDIKAYTGQAVVSVDADVFPAPEPSETPSPVHEQADAGPEAASSPRTAPGPAAGPEAAPEPDAAPGPGPTPGPTQPAPNGPPTGPSPPPWQQGSETLRPAAAHLAARPAKMLVTGPIVASLPLLILALHFAGVALNERWSWVMLISAALAFAIAGAGYRRNRPWAVALQITAIWCIAYAIYYIIYNFTSFVPAKPSWETTGAILAGVAAVLNCWPLALVIARSHGREKRVPPPLLAAFLTCMVTGLSAASIGYAVSPNAGILFRISALALFAAVVASLAAPLVARTRKQPAVPIEIPMTGKGAPPG